MLYEIYNYANTQFFVPHDKTAIVDAAENTAEALYEHSVAHLREDTIYSFWELASCSITTGISDELKCVIAHQLWSVEILGGR